MVFDCPLTDAKISGNVLARLAREYHVQDFPFARGQASQSRRRGCAPTGRFNRVRRMLQRASNTGEKLFAAKRLLNEICGAGSHCLDRQMHIAIPGDHYRW